ncbi:ABC transporter ATP-binding protein [Pseudorhodoplanes sp.]|uniref:ABC transporter ATP-binding protein n=1 Tax=Pseudorhodoplanes sp. TaxID=1934341 RepID=UPI003D0A77F3
MTAVLEARGLSAAYGHLHVLHDIDLAVGDGKVVLLLGANGAGKTTTLRAISNLMVRTRGEVTFLGTSIQGKSTESIARMGIAHVPEDRGTFLHLTVKDNLDLATYCRSNKSLIRADIQRVYDLFPRLKERERQAAGTLSGGEQQMLAIARGLLSKPKLLLLDEPSFGLAPLVVEEIFQILSEVRANEAVSILLVEQNAKIALRFSDYCYLLETGRIVMEGPASRFINDDAIRRSYLGY